MVSLSVMISSAAQFALNSYPPVIPDIMNEFGLSYSEAGLLMSLLSIMGIFLAVPAGILVIRWGLKRVGGLGLVVSTIGSGITFLGPSFIWIEIGRTIIGVGNVLILITSFSIIPIWFTKDNIGKAMGLKSLDMPLATIIALNLVPILVNAFEWRISFLVATVILIFVTAMFFLLFKEGSSPKQQRFPIESLKNKQIWLLGIIWGFFNMGIIAYVTWAGTFFIEMRGLPINLSFFIVSAVMLMVIPFGPTAGILSDKFGRKKFVMMSSLIVAISFLLIPSLPYPMMLLPVITLSVSAAFLPSPIFSLQSKVLPSGNAGVSFGVSMIFSSLGITVGPYLVGLTRDISTGMFPVFLVMSIFVFLAFIFTFLIKDKPT